MKKISIIGIISACALGMTACIGVNTKEINPNDNSAETSTVEAASEATTASDAAIDASSEASTSQEGVHDGSQAEPIKDEAIIKQLEDAGINIDDAKFSVVDDFDKDGEVEAFVYVGDGIYDDMFASYIGRIWFVTKDKAEEVLGDSPLYANINEIFKLYPLEDKTFIALNEAYATETVTHLFYVEKGECKESAVSRIGCFFASEDSDDYCISVGMYDSYCESEEGSKEEPMYSGHTWKPYYFYYDKESGDFKEYVGQSATEEELKKACGFDLAAEIRNEGYSVDGIIKRDNGMIHVNYSKTETDGGRISTQYYNANYDMNAQKFLYIFDAGDKEWMNSSFDGTYVESITAQRAN